MRKIGVWLTLVYCLFAMTAAALAQARKPGLWETTSTMTWQQSPFPAGMQGAPGGARSPFGGGPQTVRVCITQAQIDKYGAPVPQTRGDCQVTNYARTANGVTGDMVCSGRMNGKGSFESHWTGEGSSSAKFHFVGSMEAGPNRMPIEWTSESTSTYKGPNCGDVKPIPMPDK
jgi:hypothetical protein